MTTRSAPRYLWRLLALALAMLLPSLGTSIANVALPTLAAAFAAPMHDVQWVVIAYLLAVTILIVGAGRLGDLFGRRRLLLIGIALFAVASAACAIAPNLPLLVAARAMQGAGAAIMMALTIAAVGDVVPVERTGSAMGLLGTVSAVGTALGPSLGGALISALGWPAVFALVAGVATLSFVLALFTLPADAPLERKPFAFDLAGMGLLGLALAAFALATTSTGTPVQIGLMLAGLSALGLVGFVAVERRTRSPLVELALLRDRHLSTGLVSIGLVSTIMMATLVVGPFYLAGVIGLDPVRTGLVMSIGPAIAALTGIPAGRLVDRLGASAIATAGLIGVTAGSVLMALLPGRFGVGGYVAGLAIVTAGYALFQAANTTAIMAGAGKDRRGVISALLGLSRNLGLIAGASAMGAIFALGSRGLAIFGQPPGGQAGLQLTFAVAATLAALALVIGVRGFRPRQRRS